MEPKLIDRKVLKKILKKGYNQNSNMFTLNKTFKNIINIVKSNWYIILILVLLIILLTHMYIQKQQIKKQEQLDNIEIKKKKKDKKIKFKGSYESEYYKMLPKVTNSPNLIPYKY